MKLCVLGTGTVAAFAGDAEHKLLLAIDIAFVGFGLEMGGVAFHAAGADGAVEDGWTKTVIQRMSGSHAFSTSGMISSAKI